MDTDETWFTTWLRSRSVIGQLTCREARRLCNGAFGDPTRSKASEIAARLHEPDGQCAKRSSVDDD